MVSELPEVVGLRHSCPSRMENDELNKYPECHTTKQQMYSLTATFLTFSGQNDDE